MRLNLKKRRICKTWIWCDSTIIYFTIHLPFQLSQNTEGSSDGLVDEVPASEMAESEAGEAATDDSTMPLEAQEPSVEEEVMESDNGNVTEVTDSTSVEAVSEDDKVCC